MTEYDTDYVCACSGGLEGKRRRKLLKVLEKALEQEVKQMDELIKKYPQYEQVIRKSFWKRWGDKYGND